MFGSIVGVFVGTIVLLLLVSFQISSFLSIYNNFKSYTLLLLYTIHFSSFINFPFQHFSICFHFSTQYCYHILICNFVLCTQLPIIFLGLYYPLFQLGCVSSIIETKLLILILFVLLLLLLYSI